jgi:2-polyprenyl-3-methyl-5-hydroxy-6-metoxy-1,4-benzoquinol methylase
MAKIAKALGVSIEDLIKQSEEKKYMDTRQQNEALDYFKRHADDWQKKGSIDSQDKVNVIKQRNDFVLKVIGEREKTKTVLDIGCGTGALICEIASRGIHAMGIDFAKEMIEIAENNAKRIKQGKAKFECCSIFDFQFDPSKYDVISANGFIEYISHKELDQLLNLSLKALKKGGSLVLSSRNRLFNIFSLNEFTKEEVENGNITALLLEAIQIVKSENINDLVGFDTAPLQKEDERHKDTGIKVSTRYQFTPGQLVNMLKGKGFDPIEILPIHVHGVTPKFKDKHPSVHGNIANLLQNCGSMSLIPQSSSFMIHVKKA